MNTKRRGNSLPPFCSPRLLRLPSGIAIPSPCTTVLQRMGLFIAVLRVFTRSFSPNISFTVL